MRTNSFPSRRAFAITATLAFAAAFSAETYIASGWAHLKGKSETGRIGVTESLEDADLESIFNQHPYCHDDTSKPIRSNGYKNKLSVWLSPYRRFPEAPSEGDSRGRGDYEYFSYLTNSECRRIASNYGAFKGSPADKLFRKASEQGLRAEFLLAQELGYTLFVLDERKIWLGKKDQALCAQDKKTCIETNNGFIVVNLKAKEGLARNLDFLLNSTRLGEGMTLAQSIEAHSITPARSRQWHAWESPERGTALRWSDGTGKPNDRIELLTPYVGGQSPANLTTFIIINPSVKSLLVELACTRGTQPNITLTVQGNRDISEYIDTCLPKSARVLRSTDQNGLTVTHRAPKLSETDPRQTFFGLMYRMNT